MLRTLIRKELLEIVISAKFVVAFVATAAVVILGTSVGAESYLAARDEARLQQEQNFQQLTSQGDWLEAARLGVTELREPYVLSIFDRGIADNLGRIAAVNADVDTRLDKSRNLTEPILALFGSVDFTFAVRVILSLFAFLMTYDAVCGERERGTLRLLLSGSVPRHRVILAKIGGSCIALTVALAGAAVIALLNLAIFFPSVLAHFDLAAWWRFGAMIAMYLLYLVVFAAAGLMVSALVRNSATSFVILLMVWILFVGIVPQLSTAVAERIVPNEPYIVLQTRALKEISEQRDERLAELESGDTWRKAMRENRVAQLYAERAREFASLQSEVLDRYNHVHHRQQSSQILLAEAIARTLSPTSAMGFAVQDLAGSGWARQGEYLSQLRVFQRSFRQYIFDSLDNVYADEGENIFEKIHRNEFLPIGRGQVTFEFAEERPLSIVLRILWDYAALAIFATVFFAVAYTAFIRYDIR